MVAHRELAQVIVGRVCPEFGVKCFSVLFRVTTVWQLLAFSHNSMSAPSAGTCRHSSGDVVDVPRVYQPLQLSPGLLWRVLRLMNRGQQSQTFQYSHLWNYLYETLISHGLQQISFLLVQRMRTVHDYKDFLVRRQSVLTLCINTTCFPL